MVLFNNGTTAVDMTGWALWFQDPTGDPWLQTTLSGASLAPGASYLIAFQPISSPAGAKLQPWDLFGGSVNIFMTSGELALTSTEATPTGPTSSNVVDFVGYGPDANAFEGGGAAPSPATGAIVRAAGGCIDTNSNAADFTTASPVPVTSADTAAPCVKLTVPTAGQTVAEGQPLSFSVNASPGMTVTISGIPADSADAQPPALVATGGSTSTFTWTPGFDRAAASPYTVKFTATIGQVVLTKSVQIAVSNTDRPPTIDAGPDLHVTVGTPVHINAVATDPDGDTITSRAVHSSPAGSTFDDRTGAFEWTPSAAQVGDNAITFVASDGTLSAERTVHVFVQAPAVASAGVSSRRVGSAGITLTTTLTGPGTVVVTVSRCSGSKCASLKGSITYRGHRGKNHFTFKPELRGRRLAPGHYLLHVGVKGQKGAKTLRVTVK